MNDHQEDYHKATRLIMESNVKKTLEIAEVKTAIIDSVLGEPKDNGNHYKILSLGCSVVSMGLAARGHEVTSIFCPAGQQEYLTKMYDEHEIFRSALSHIKDPKNNLYKKMHENGSKWCLDDEIAAGNVYDIVLGLDQTMTWFNTEDEQREFIKQVGQVTKGTFITSLVDYKNQTSQSRMADLPLTININGKQNLFINHRSWNPSDRQCYENHWLHIEEDKLIGTSTTKRRTMFFKQLAKFSSDAGSTGFRIHKNLFYKPLINKTFEHVISIDYE